MWEITIPCNDVAIPQCIEIIYKLYNDITHAITAKSMLSLIT